MLLLPKAAGETAPVGIASMRAQPPCAPQVLEISSCVIAAAENLVRRERNNELIERQRSRYRLSR